MCVDVNKPNCYIDFMEISTGKILKNDYLALVSLLLPSVFIVLYVDALCGGVLRSLLKIGRTGIGEPKTFLYIVIASVLIFVPLLIYRITAMKNHFKNGVTVDGRITYLEFYKDRGRVEYKYSYNDEQYESGNALPKNAYTSALKKDMLVSLIINKDNPKKAFIKELFTKKQIED